MKAKFSTYLNDIAPGLKDLIAELAKSYDYVSVLSTDSVGFNVRVSQRVKSVSCFFGIFQIRGFIPYHDAF